MKHESIFMSMILPREKSRNPGRKGDKSLRAKSPGIVPWRSGFQARLENQDRGAFGPKFGMGVAWQPFGPLEWATNRQNGWGSA
jgi:hypothetical protein